jgi:hypothetical protein
MRRSLVQRGFRSSVLRFTKQGQCEIDEEIPVEAKDKKRTLSVGNPASFSRRNGWIQEFGLAKRSSRILERYPGLWTSESYLRTVALTCDPLTSDTVSCT